MSGILRKPAQMATYYSHWRHALLIHDGDLFPRKRFRQRIRFFIMTPVSPLGYTESLEDERLMMEILRGRLHCRHSESTNCWHVFRLPAPGSQYLRRVCPFC